ncbi:NIF3-like protein 1 isoform X2 [Aplysia californica]|nr:NIF3-like protein 1 isoform X2 [Aplysia californica]
MNSLDTVVAKLKKFAPLSLAGSWDNVGLLVEPSPPKYISKMMLTNDLTTAVVEEAKEKTVDLILSYHPPIFKPLKRLTQSSWKERVLIECAESRIAVFSPHTSYDAVEGGVNDWLLSAFDLKKGSVRPLEVSQTKDCRSHLFEVDVAADRLKEMRDEILVSCLPADSPLTAQKTAFSTVVLRSTGSEQLRLQVACNSSELNAIITALTLCKAPETYRVTPLSQIPRPAAGAGRVAELAEPLSLELLVSRVKTFLGLKHVAVAKAVGEEDPEVSSVAVCAGSGGSVLGGVPADLLLTGEMSHHEVLDAVHRGSSVILCHHSNTERGFLVPLRDKLSGLLGSSVDIFISETDRDPLETV